MFYAEEQHRQDIEIVEKSQYEALLFEFGEKQAGVNLGRLQTDSVTETTLQLCSLR